MTVKRILIVIRHAPHGTSWTREGLEAALVGAALGQEVSLLFTGDGILSLLKGQAAGPLGQKGTAAMIDVLSMYDIEHLWVDEAALVSRGLTAAALMADVTLADPAQLIAEHEVILSF